MEARKAKLSELKAIVADPRLLRGELSAKIDYFAMPISCLEDKWAYDEK